MKKAHKILLNIGVFAIGFCSVAFLGNKIFVEASEAAKTVNCGQSQISSLKPDYPTNKNGQTYGEVPDVMPEDYPDLVGVVATNGKEGYVYKEDFLDEYIPQSPEDAVEYMNVLKELNDQGIYFKVSTVYEYDGETVVGEFETSIDVGLCFDQETSIDEIEKTALDREALYEKSRSEGKYLREDFQTLMMNAKSKK